MIKWWNWRMRNKIVMIRSLWIHVWICAVQKDLSYTVSCMKWQVSIGNKEWVSILKITRYCRCVDCSPVWFFRNESAFWVGFSRISGKYYKNCDFKSIAVSYFPTQKSWFTSICDSFLKNRARYVNSAYYDTFQI